jgi:hypothetical protein
VEQFRIRSGKEPTGKLALLTVREVRASGHRLDKIDSKKK